MILAFANDVSDDWKALLFISQTKKITDIKGSEAVSFQLKFYIPGDSLMLDLPLVGGLVWGR